MDIIFLNYDTYVDVCAYKGFLESEIRSEG